MIEGQTYQHTETTFVYSLLCWHILCCLLFELVLIANCS